MTRRKSKSQLLQEWWQIKKDWYNVYQWTSLATGSYTETISSLIMESIDEIRIELFDLRQSEFRLDSHRGQAALNTPITQFTEKRFCRAMFNAHNVPPLGNILDYEVPLQAISKANHGDIDLIAQNENGVLIIESKQPQSHDSILKAILQAFTYTMLISSIRQTFTSEFGVNEKMRLIPAVLTFDVATSGKQLRQSEQLPNTIALLKRLNRLLSFEKIEPIEFYEITDYEADLSHCLTSRMSQRGETLIEFARNYLPEIKQVKL